MVITASFLGVQIFMIFAVLQLFFFSIPKINENTFFFFVEMVLLKNDMSIYIQKSGPLHVYCMMIKHACQKLHS